MKTKTLTAQLSRPAIVMELGGFRPPTDLAASWFGRVNLALPEETWPLSDGKPMHALCQINLSELPFKPPRLDDVDLIAVFIGPSELPIDMPNGEGWCLRAYKDLKKLCPLEQVKTGSSAKALPMRANVVKNDFPCLDDVSDLGVDVDEDDYSELYKNSGGLKLGGWPSLIQSEIYWAAWNCHAKKPEYVFQIDSTEKGNWQWGDGGVGYFGRGTEEGLKDDWTLAWQCC